MEKGYREYYILCERHNKSLNLISDKNSEYTNDMNWGQEPRVKLQTKREWIDSIIGANFARTGFCRTVKPGDKIFAIDVKTNEKIPVFKANSDGSWKCLMTESLSRGK